MNKEITRTAREGRVTRTREEEEEEEEEEEKEGDQPRKGKDFEICRAEDSPAAALSPSTHGRVVAILLQRNENRRKRGQEKAGREGERDRENEQQQNVKGGRTKIGNMTNKQRAGFTSAAVN